MNAESFTLSELIEQHGGLIQTGPFGSQLHQHEYVDSGVPVVMPKDIAGGRVSDAGIAMISENKANALARHKLEKGDIVFPRRGDIRKCALIGEDQEGYLCGTGCLKITLPDQVYSPHFLYYYLVLPKVGEWLERNAVGTTMLNLNTSILGGVSIPDKSIDEQNEIVSILSAYDNLIENNRRRIQLLEESARLLYKEWFVRLRFPGHEHVKVVDGVPEGWEKKALSFFCHDMRNAINPADVPSETPYIGLEHIPRRSITLGECGYASDVDSQKFKFSEGNILFGKIRPYFHKVGIALVDGITSSDAIVIQPVSDEVRMYVLMLLSSDRFVNLASQTVKEGSKMPRADWKYLLKCDFLNPPQSILSAFNSFVEPIIDKLKILSTYNRNLAQARDLLLPKLMNGEVAV